MAKTESTMMALGTTAPDFALADAVTGKTVRRDDLRGGPALLVMFICNHCPFVIHVRDELVRIAHAYAAHGVRSVAINANSVASHPQDGPERMRELAVEQRWAFPFLYDEAQTVAKAYRAACTPDLYVFDRDLQLVYRGQVDDSRPGNDKPVDGRDLRAALDAVLAGRPVPAEQKPSIGCNIKWIPGNEPDYART